MISGLQRDGASVPWPDLTMRGRAIQHFRHGLAEGKICLTGTLSNFPSKALRRLCEVGRTFVEARWRLGMTDFRGCVTPRSVA
jgi:hypothetical protein